MGVNSKVFIILILTVISFGDCKNLFELKANNTSTNYTKQLSSYSFGYCTYDYNCLGFNKKCVDAVCRCAPNYKYNIYSSKCEYFSCTWNFDCQEYDYNRYCSSGYCYCYSGYYSDSLNGGKCKYSYTPSYSYTYSYDYTWLWILVGIVIPLKIAFIVIYIRRRRRLVTVVRANQQPIAIVANTGYVRY